MRITSATSVQAMEEAGLLRHRHVTMYPGGSIEFYNGQVYVETQIKGGVSLDDVEHIVLYKYDDTTTEEIEKLNGQMRKNLDKAGYSNINIEVRDAEGVVHLKR